MGSLHLLLERFLEFKHRGQRLHRLTHAAFPFLQFRIAALKPDEILLPFAHVSEKITEIPFVRLGNFGANWNCGRHSEKDESGTQETKKRVSQSCEIPGFQITWRVRE